MEDNAEKNQAMKYYEALTKTVKWAEEFEEIKNLNKYLGTILYTSPSKLTIYQGETEDISLTVRNKDLADLKNVTARLKDDEGNIIYESEAFDVPSGCSIELPLGDEEIFGFGLQLKKMCHRRTKKTVRANADALADSGDSHAPVPFFVTNRGYGIYADTARYASFYCCVSHVHEHKAEKKNIATTTEELYAAKKNENSVMLIDIPAAKGVDLYIFEVETILDIVSTYNMFSGSGCMPALWGLGVLYRCYAKSTDKDVLNFAEYFRSNHIPCDIIGLEPGWQTHAYSCTFVWDGERCGEWKSMLDSIKKANYHVNLWEHAFVSSESPIYEKLKNHSGDFEVWEGLVPDFADGEAAEIFADYHKNALIDNGISGFKLDECDGSDFTGGWTFPNSSQFPSGTDGEQMHNMFGILYQKALLKAFGNMRTFSQARNSGACASPYPFVLYSDLYAHKDFIRGTVNAGFSGLLWSPEIRHAASKKDMIRRLQSVVFSQQAVLNRWNQPVAPWIKWDAVDEAREILNIRMSLVPYLYSAFYEYYKIGKPPVRALVCDYEEDFNCFSVDNEYLFGNLMLIAPMTTEQEERTVYLPNGVWFDFWSGKRFEGGAEITAATEKISVYVKENPENEHFAHLAAKGLEEWFNYKGNPINAKPVNVDNGGYYESVSYFDFAVREYLMFRKAYRKTFAKPPFDDKELLTGAAEYFAVTYYRTDRVDSYINFGDTGGFRFTKEDAGIILSVIYLLGEELDLPNMRWYAQSANNRKTEIEDVIYYENIYKKPAYPPEKTSAFYEKIGWAVFHDSYEKNSTLFAVKCGDTWNHAHSDAGHFILYRGGRDEIYDSGACAYVDPLYRGYYTTSKAHNVVLFNGKGQDERDILDHVRMTGRLYNFTDKDGFRYVAADATGPMGRYFRKHLRHFLWLDGFILIYDDIESYEDGEVNFLLHAKTDSFTMLSECSVSTEKGYKSYNTEDIVDYTVYTQKTENCRAKFVSVISLDGRESSIENIENGIHVHAGDTDIYINLLSDGRIMHDNCINVMCGIVSNAVIGVINKSILIKDNESFLDTLSRVNGWTDSLK